VAPDRLQEHFPPGRLSGCRYPQQEESFR
jgi:hypothetical protein